VFPVTPHTPPPALGHVNTQTESGVFALTTFDTEWAGEMGTPVTGFLKTDAFVE